ncbi:hydrolase [Mycolicibacterium farcinogenes]|uniref:Hydrolase n=1 Tax=Mycolicibacterium farcinogenes TaxID=1802 RepID=A0ACD1FI59_MYCFR|nr:hydrolase [Mycolicibacterium farcinogenes]QZH66607.1 hydrolase [Mycolicibacterium farcinogenes]
MPTWICTGCGVDHPDSATEPAAGCVLTSDVVSIEERGDLPPHGTWTTLDELAAQPHHTEHVDHGRGVHSLRRTPKFAIGHRTFLAQTAHGNLLWDSPGYLDDEILSLVHGLGGVAAVAASHPHMFGAQLSWSQAFGGVPVYVNALDAEWLPAPDPLIVQWTGELEPLPGLRLIHVGGHMRGSSVALTADGTLLAGDTISGGLAKNWVSFQRNYPKHVPLSAAVVRRIVDRLDAYDYDRLYTLGGDEIDIAAKEVVHRSAETHIRWVSGEFDHLT